MSLITWGFVVKRIPWGLVYLVGAGMAMNQGMKKSGLAKQICNTLENMKHWPYEAQIFIVILVSGLLSQVFVSIAATNTILSFLLPLSTKLTVHPLRFCLPVSLVATGAYLLPVSGASLGMVTALGNIRPQSVLLVGLFPWMLTIIFTYIHAIAWMRVVYPNHIYYPAGLTANMSGYEDELTTIH